MIIPARQPLNAQRVLNLVGGTIVGLAFMLFFIEFVGGLGLLALFIGSAQ